MGGHFCLRISYIHIMFDCPLLSINNVVLQKYEFRRSLYCVLHLKFQYSKDVKIIYLQKIRLYKIFTKVFVLEIPFLFFDSCLFPIRIHNIH